MKLYKIDFAKLTIEYAKKYCKPYNGTQLKGFYERSPDSSEMKKNVVAILHDSNGRVKSKYLTIDYKALAMALLEKYGTVHSPAYLKGVYTGKYNSKKMLSMIHGVLEEE